MFAKTNIFFDMKKFLEILVDDEGKLHCSTDYVFHDSVLNPPEKTDKVEKDFEALSKQLIGGLVETVWKDRNFHVGKAIRFLSMAEVISCAEPYQNAEDLWSSLMFHYIPFFESFASGLKTPYGYDSTKIIRPITSGFFPIGMTPEDIKKMMN